MDCIEGRFRAGGWGTAYSASSEVAPASSSVRVETVVRGDRRGIVRRARLILMMIYAVMSPWLAAVPSIMRVCQSRMPPRTKATHAETQEPLARACR